MHPVTSEILDALAKVSARFPLAETALRAGIRRPILRKHLHLGAIAHRYPPALGRRELRIADMDGYRLWVNVGEFLGVAPYFFGEPCVAWLTRDLLRPGDTCIDAGANVGLYTFLCASAVGQDGRVFAFEANPEFAALIGRSIALNGFERIVHVSGRAVYSKTGEMKRLFLSENLTNSGTSSLLLHASDVSANSTVDVETIALDDFARENSIDRVRLVKIDVERAEEFVIAGAAEMLAQRRIDYLIVEMLAGHRVQQLLEEAGYQGHLLDPWTRSLVPIAAVARDRFADYLFVRPGLQPPNSSPA